jgi:hypothetical protein
MPVAECSQAKMIIPCQAQKRNSHKVVAAAMGKGEQPTAA